MTSPPPRLRDSESGERRSKEELRAAEPALRVDLLNAQYDLRNSERALLIVITGDDRPGCEALVDRLHEWLDARYLDLHAFPALEPDPPGQPLLWKYWCALPRRGRSAIHLGAWAWRALADRVEERLDDAGLEALLARLSRFERDLVDAGIRLVKLWLHQPREELDKRLKKARSNPESGWDLEAARAVLTALRAPDPAARAAAAPDAIGEPRLARLETAAPIGERDSERRLDQLQVRLAHLSREARAAGLASAIVFEGVDAAGKGGAIRRLTRAMAARDYRVVPVAAPSEEERAYPYLWRFWTRLPGAGRMGIFDRSWYGRVLVERVEGFARPDEWQRAYGEIDAFESELLAGGVALCKLWLHIDRDEQLRRFEAREQTPYKKYKIGPDDYRNRGRWDEYVAAAEEMFARTDRAEAPWHVIAANDKRQARVRVLDCVCETLERGLARHERREG